jgi:hypothetical protein
MQWLNIGESIELLYAIGARDFIVLNLPDPGAIPLAREHPAARLLLRAFRSA